MRQGSIRLLALGTSKVVGIDKSPWFLLVDDPGRFREVEPWNRLGGLQDNLVALFYSIREADPGLLRASMYGVVSTEGQFALAFLWLASCRLLLTRVRPGFLVGL